MGLRVGNGVWGCVFSPDGRYLLTCEDNYLCESWDMKTRKSMGVLRSVSDWPAISPDGSRLAALRGIWCFPSLAPVAEIEPGNKTAWLPGQPSFVTEAPSGAPAIRLFQRRRPEAAYGLLWLPQCWLSILGALASIWLIRRDIRRWLRNPPLPP